RSKEKDGPFLAGWWANASCWIYLEGSLKMRYCATFSRKVGGRNVNYPNWLTNHFPSNGKNVKKTKIHRKIACLAHRTLARHAEERLRLMLFRIPNCRTQHKMGIFHEFNKIPSVPLLIVCSCCSSTLKDAFEARTLLKVGIA